jgi:hypothetical protein
MMHKLIKRNTSKRDKAKKALKGWALWKVAPTRALAVGGGFLAAVGGALAVKKRKGSDTPSYTPPTPPPAPPTAA